MAYRIMILIALSMPALAAAQPRTPEACAWEIHRTEVTIAEARKKAEYRTERGRHVLSTSDRWVNKARKHAAKGETRGCVDAAQKGRIQLSSR